MRYAKDVPIVVESTDGRRVKLPDLGSNAQTVVSALRAWLKAGARE